MRLTFPNSLRAKPFFIVFLRRLPSKILFSISEVESSSGDFSEGSKFRFPTCASGLPRSTLSSTSAPRISLRPPPASEAAPPFLPWSHSC